jgi:DNA polymerase V
MNNRRYITMSENRISAGFPSPAESYAECRLDLNEYLIPNPASTFFVRVEGESMSDYGINTGDLLIVDKSLPVFNGSIVIAALNGEFTVKSFYSRNGRIELYPGNKSYSMIEVTAEDDFEVWGIVIHCIKSFSMYQK